MGEFTKKLWNTMDKAAYKSKNARRKSKYSLQCEHQRKCPWTVPIFTRLNLDIIQYL